MWEALEELLTYEDVDSPLGSAAPHHERFDEVACAHLLDKPGVLLGAPPGEAVWALRSRNALTRSCHEVVLIAVGSVANERQLTS